MPLCTVVVPCYNQAEYLAECLASIVGQSFADWEAIVVDDGSDRGDVPAIVAAIDDARVTCIRHGTNKGLAASRNTGINAGSGDFLLCVDSDDRISPQFLGRLVPMLDDDPNADCAFPDFRLFGAGDGIRTFEVRSTRELLRGQWLPGPGCLMRRSLWQGVGGFCDLPELLAGNEDWDFYLGAAEQDFVPRHLQEPLYEYRIHSGSMSPRLRYVDHETREFIYRRHRVLFERYDAGKGFLAEGYFRSADSSLEKGEWMRAMRLGARGTVLAPRNLRFAWSMLRALTPDPVANVVRQCRATVRRRRQARSGQ